MKKLLIIIVVMILVSIGIGIGFGKGNGSGEGSGNSKKVEMTKDKKDNFITEEQDKKEEKSELIISVTVVENEFFYDNQRIALEDFLKEIQLVEGEYIVQVNDDNASLKAYTNLIHKLKEEKIDYVEK